MTAPATGDPALLIQLVPRFRPDVDGVGECALHLGNALEEFHGIGSQFIAAHPPAPELSIDPGAEPRPNVTRLSELSAAALGGELDRLAAPSPEPPVLLLHYVSYGYSPQGTPGWLPDALERFKMRGGHVVTLFHELYARGRFPSKTFFASGLQRRIFGRLLAASDAAFTSNEPFLALARAENGQGRPLGPIGICSNVGEPDHVQPIEDRAGRIAVFGKLSTRQRLYARYAEPLLAVARHLGINEIADIGPGAVELDPPPLAALVRTYGALPAGEVSALLADSTLGAVSNPYSLSGKSGVIAAYQAHGAAILHFPFADENDPPEPANWAIAADELLALPVGSAVLTERLEQSAAAGLWHYREHRSARAMADTIQSALEALR